jgi:hypothetical protein
MPKISPRLEITSHPLYQSTMAAQHLAYQLMREVPPDHKVEATRLHRSTVHATTYATYALDPGRPDRAAQYGGLAAAASEALERLGPIAHLGQDSAILQKTLEEIRKTAAEEKEKERKEQEIA